MACYMDEEEIWKCPTHPSKRRRTGICPTCLRDRLNTLCPHCAKLRPCDCCPTSSSSSSSSSSFSFFSGVASGDGEPSMRRSRSLAIPFLRSRSRYAPNLEFTDQKPPLPPASTDQKIPSATGSSRGKTTSLLSLFKTSKSKKLGEELEKEKEEVKKTGNDLAWMKRSRSVSVPIASNSRAVENKSAVKTRGWHFPSPFRQSKSSRVLEEQQSTLCKV